MPKWTVAEVSDQRGRTVVITGANSGIGRETAEVLAARGASVVLACRDHRKATATAAALPGGTATTVDLDLGSLASVRRAADELRSRHSRLDLLINNAGLMMPPYGRTEDGFELQLGINHLGHFALTGLLLDRLLGTPGSRIVTVSSSAHRQGHIDVGDLQFERRRYRPTAAYSQSKLANLLFTYELQRRLAAAGADPIAVALEPGIVSTDLQRHASGAMGVGIAVVGKLLGQPTAAAGALATLRAATDPAVRGADYCAPDGRLLNASGHPVRIASSAASHDVDAQRRLWAESERLTGVTFPIIGAPHDPLTCGFRSSGVQDRFHRGGESCGAGLVGEDDGGMAVHCVDAQHAAEPAGSTGISEVAGRSERPAQPDGLPLVDPIVRLLRQFDGPAERTLRCRQAGAQVPGQIRSGGSPRHRLRRGGGSTAEPTVGAGDEPGS